MADITLAECEGSVWLVSDEASLDDLLANTLPTGISIEIVPCASRANVMELWVQNCGLPDRTGDPWLIHPAIVKRIRGAAPDHAVFFAQWSAMLDRDAETVIHAAAIVAHQHLEAPVTLVEYLDEGAARALVDLSRLRATMIEDRLAAEGVDPGRIAREARATGIIPGMAAESQRVDIVVRLDGA